MYPVITLKQLNEILQAAEVLYLMAAEFFKNPTTTPLCLGQNLYDLIIPYYRRDLP